MAAPGELLRDAEIQADRLGMADMQVAVRFRRKPRDDQAMLFGVEVGLDDIADEIAACLGSRWFYGGHAGFLVPKSKVYLPNPPLPRKALVIWGS